MNRKLLALYGLKWSPFSPEVPAEALYVSRQVESFCWRVENLVSDSGFALVTGQPGLGKSVGRLSRWHTGSARHDQQKAGGYQCRQLGMVVHVVGRRHMLSRE